MEFKLPSTAQPARYPNAANARHTHDFGTGVAATTVAGSGGSGHTNIGAGSGQNAPILDASKFATGKGGGALRSITENFQVHPANGTFSLSIPVHVSEARGKFQPSLSLSYNSGTGNGAFGIGWQMSTESITRKTSKQIPLYDEFDIYILSGAEDLVPITTADGNLDERIRDGYVIHRYRPRIEQDVIRIERWAREGDPSDIHWRTISFTNVTKIFGLNDESRVYGDRLSNEARGKRIFSWLLCESYDPAGNSMVFSYKAEDGHGVEDGTGIKEVFESNRDPDARTRARYIKSIKYGNRTPSRDMLSWSIVPETASKLDSGESPWMFEVIFDYGEHNYSLPTVDCDQEWDMRKDVFSTYTSGFEIRQYRLCKRILMFHHIPDRKSGREASQLVSSTVLEYNEKLVGSFLKSVTRCGHILGGDKAYKSESLAPYIFSYTPVPAVETLKCNTAKPSCIQTVPISLPETVTRWIDLDGEGSPGLLVQRHGAWYYQRNENAIRIHAGRDVDSKGVGANGGNSVRGGGYGGMTDGEDTEPEESEGSQTQCDIMDHFGPTRMLTLQPNVHDQRECYFEDLDRNGFQDLVTIDEQGRMCSYYERLGAEQWSPLKYFSSMLNMSLEAEDKSLRRIDLTGNGLADILIGGSGAGMQELVWYESLGKQGFMEAKRIHAQHAAAFPQLLVGDHRSRRATYMADMSGDRLADIVQVSNGRISYWPNLGYGRFEKEVVMANSPVFDYNEDLFTLERMHLLDIDGSGTTDIVYLPPTGGAVIYYNHCGNSWSNGVAIPSFPRIDNLSSVFALDLLGKGTSCLCWTGPATNSTDNLIISYLDLAPGTKPHLLKSFTNGIGLRTSISYLPSTTFYLRDEREQKPWKTKLPFPVHTVSRIVEKDDIALSTRTMRYRYHDGYWDGHEREFQGFGMVEMWDVERYVLGIGKGYTKPTVYRKLWFHNGSRDTALAIPSSTFDTPKLRSKLGENLSTYARREACRALKGREIRVEIYGSHNATVPLSVVESSFEVTQIQCPKDATSGIFKVLARETLTFNYEQEKANPRIEHDLILEHNAYSDITKSASVHYGQTSRMVVTGASSTSLAPQECCQITYTETLYTNAIDERISDNFYKPSVAATRQSHLVGVTIDGLLDIDMLREDNFAFFHPKEQDMELAEGTVVRLVPGKESRMYYRSQDMSRRLPLGGFEPFSIPDQAFKLALTPTLLTEAYGVNGGKLKECSLGSLMKEGGYVDLDSDDRWWAPSSRSLFPYYQDAPATLAAARMSFFVATLTIDPFGNESQVEMDEFCLLPRKVVDAVGNVTTAENDYRTLRPAMLTDCNGNRTHILMDAFGERVAMARMGKEGQAEGDTLSHVEGILPIETIRNFMEKPSAGMALDLLGTASHRWMYCRMRFKASDGETLLPTFRVELSRTQHVSGGSSGDAGDILVKINYFNGRAASIQDVSLASRSTTCTWCFSARTISDAGGNVVGTFQPYLSQQHEFRTHCNATSATLTITFRDALNRTVGTLNPDHTWTKTRFSSWSRTTFDAGNTIAVSDPATDLDLACHFTGLDSTMFQPSWNERIHRFGNKWEKDAARKSEVYVNNNVVVYYDGLGRDILEVQLAGPKRRLTELRYDVHGNNVEKTDALGRIVELSHYDLLGQCISRVTMDAGEKVFVYDCLKNPILERQGRGVIKHIIYDELRRMIELRGRDSDTEYLWSRIVFGEGEADAAINNLRGQRVRIYDQSGVRRNLRYDFKSICVSSSIQLAVNYKSTLNWDCLGDVELENEVYRTTIAVDALGHPTRTTDPHGRTTHRAYNLLGQLRSVKSFTTMSGFTTMLNHISNIEYTEDGRRSRVDYGNTMHTTYGYDAKTRRLIHKRTWRDHGEVVEDIRYTYDSIGKITHVKDASQQDLYFRQCKVSPAKDYRYDAFGRLILATGREMIDSNGGTRTLRQFVSSSPIPRGKAPIPCSRIEVLIIIKTIGTLPSNGSQLTTYTESYAYDDADNLLRMSHVAADPSITGWTRVYHYEHKSQVESAEVGNLLSRSVVGSLTEEYRYENDAGSTGCMTSMVGYSMLRWDSFDRLRCSARQRVRSDVRTPETTWFVYDLDGKRVRKVTERCTNDDTTPRKRKETIYLPCAEIYRTCTGDGITTRREICTSLIESTSDQGAPLVAIETCVLGRDTLATPLIRYTLSPSLEVDNQGRVVSYEEYTPFGSSTLLSCMQGAKAPREYRFASYRRDKETGLYLCGKRYYAPWLGRWTSPDPLGTVDGLNIFSYVGNDPVNWKDPKGTVRERTHQSHESRAIERRSMHPRYQAAQQGNTVRPFSYVHNPDQSMNNCMFVTTAYLNGTNARSLMADLDVRLHPWTKGFTMHQFWGARQRQLWSVPVNVGRGLTVHRYRFAPGTVLGASWETAFSRQVAHDFAIGGRPQGGNVGFAVRTGSSLSNPTGGGHAMVLKKFGTGFHQYRDYQAPHNPGTTNVTDLVRELQNVQEVNIFWTHPASERSGHVDHGEFNRQTESWPANPADWTWESFSPYRT